MSDLLTKLEELSKQWSETATHEATEMGNSQYANALDQCSTDLDRVLATVREEKPEPRCPNCEHATPHTSGDEWDDRLTNQTRNVR